MELVKCETLARVAFTRCLFELWEWRWHLSFWRLDSLTCLTLHRSNNWIPPPLLGLAEYDGVERGLATLTLYYTYLAFLFFYEVSILIF